VSELDIGRGSPLDDADLPCRGCATYEVDRLVRVARCVQRSDIERMLSVDEAKVISAADQTESPPRQVQGNSIVQTQIPLPLIIGLIVLVKLGVPI